MSPDPRSAIGFGLRFLPLFLALLCVYPGTLRIYQPVVLGVSNGVTAWLSPPTRLEADPAGGWHASVLSAEGEKRHFQSWAGFVPHLIYLNLALLPALILATPTALRHRFRLLGWALLLLFAVHVLCLTGLVRLTHCLSVSPGAFVCLWLLRLVYASGQISAAILWALLTWRVWFPPAAPGSSR